MEKNIKARIVGKFNQIKSSLMPSQKSHKESSPDADGGADVVTTVIGEFGRWQLYIVFLLSLFQLPCTFHIYLPTFTARTADFWCRKPENLTSLSLATWINYSQPMGPCTVRLLNKQVTAESIVGHTAPMLNFHECAKWDYDKSEVGDTIISEWNLVCNRAVLATLADLIFLFGAGAGGVVGGYLSDKYGRKQTLMFMLVAQSFLSIVSLLVCSYLQFIIMRLFMGFVSVAVVFAAFVLAVELVDGIWVTIAGVSIFLWIPVAYILVTLISLALPNWRDLQLCMSLPGCLLLGLWSILPESPRWLISIGKPQEAKLILEKAAKFNGRELPPDIDQLLEHKVENEEGSRFLMLFRGNLKMRTIYLALISFALVIAYYGLVLNIDNFNLGNLHVSSIILSVVEIPAILTSIPILLKAGRRIPIFISMLACGAACLADEIFLIASADQWLMIVCLMIGKFAICVTNMMLPIYTVELYPIVVRNLGVGTSQLASGVGLICIPYLWQLADIHEHMPVLTIAVISAMGGATVLLLPETTGMEDPQTVIDNQKPPTDNSSPSNGPLQTTVGTSSDI